MGVFALRFVFRHEEEGKMCPTMCHQLMDMSHFGKRAPHTVV